MECGGVPEWLLPYTTKESQDADGLYNLRTPDPDYLAVSARYLHALMRWFLHTLLKMVDLYLYSVENEYDWFEDIFEEKVLPTRVMRSGPVRRF